MKHNSSEHQLSEMAELLRSLQETVRRVRRQAEILCRDLLAGDDSKVEYGSRKIAALEGLIRSCQKVEINLVEQFQQRDGIARGSRALDLEEARREIELRLSRLRISRDDAEISE